MTIGLIAIESEFAVTLDVGFDISTAAVAELLYRKPGSDVEINGGGVVSDQTKITAVIAAGDNDTVGKWLFRAHVVTASADIYYSRAAFVEVVESYFPFDSLAVPKVVLAINTLSYQHNNLLGIEGNGYRHISGAEQTDYDLSAALAHDQVHDIDGTDHNGLSGASIGDLLLSNASGLPARSNTPTVGQDFTTQNISLAAGKAVKASATGYYQLGADGVEGTWRIIRDMNDLVFQRYEGGSWVQKGSISA